jgi:hypothetical protein
MCLYRLESRQTTRIKLADSDRDWFGSNRLTWATRIKLADSDRPG